jgi:hypothetical protein
MGKFSRCQTSRVRSSRAPRARCRWGAKNARSTIEIHFAGALVEQQRVYLTYTIIATLDDTTIGVKLLYGNGEVMRWGAMHHASRWIPLIGTTCAGYGA